MRVEFEGGPADGVREEAPDDISEIFLTDVGPARAKPDPFAGRPLGQTLYTITDRKTIDGGVIFKYVESVLPRSIGSDDAKSHEPSGPSSS